MGELHNRFVALVSKDIGKDKAEDLLKHLKNNRIDGEKLLRISLEDLANAIDNWCKQNGFGVMTILNTLVKARDEIKHQRLMETALRSAIPAIMTGPGGPVNSSIVKKIRSKEKQKH